MLRSLFLYLDLLKERGRLYKVAWWMDIFITCIFLIPFLLAFGGYLERLIFFLIIILVGYCTFIVEESHRDYDNGNWWKDVLSPFVLFSLKLSVVPFIHFYYSCWKLTLSVLLLAFFFSPVTYVILLLISEHIFLPNVRFGSFHSREDYFEEFLENPSNENLSRWCPEILAFHFRGGNTNYKSYRPLIRSLSSYVLLFRLSEESPSGFWREFLNYKNFMFVLSSLLLFVLSSLAFRTLIEECFFPSHKHFWEAISIIAFTVWMYFLVRLLLFFFPENLYFTLENFIPNREIVDNFNFYYRLPGEASWEELPIPRNVSFPSERGYIREIIITLLAVPVIQFLLTSDLWDLNKKEVPHKISKEERHKNEVCKILKEIFSECKEGFSDAVKDTSGAADNSEK